MIEAGSTGALEDARPHMCNEVDLKQESLQKIEKPVEEEALLAKALVSVGWNGKQSCASPVLGSCWLLEGCLSHKDLSIILTTIPPRGSLNPGLLVEFSVSLCARLVLSKFMLFEPAAASG